MEPNTTQETEFIWRRLTEALHLFGKEIDGYFWLAILIPVLIVAFSYVIWMYVRDGRSVGWPWAAFLAALRSTVYVILAVVFLLPAEQTWDRSETRSRVVFLIDVSGSMGSRDGLPTEAIPAEKLPSRQDQVIQLLTNEQLAFIKRLQEKNPVTVYRFGPQIDEAFKLLEPDHPWTKADWISWLKPDPKQEIPEEMEEEEKASLRKKLALNAFLVSGTNLADSLLSVINRESNNMLQGVVVISDGHSTQFSEETFREVHARANKERAKIPIFTVVVGEHREPIEIRITDLQVPEQVRPDDKFPIRVEIDGKGLADKDVQVTVEATKPNGEKVTFAPDLKAGESVKFKPGDPPHAQAPFEIDTLELEGDWKFVATVPKDKREAFLPKNHVTDPEIVHVVKKPLRVLLFSSGTGKEYQFLRTMFVREMDKGRTQLSICLQLPPEKIANIVQDIPGERMLKRFPHFFRSEDDPGVSAEDKYENLAQYDLIIAIDPDWTQLGSEQIDLLENWIGSHRGGLILMGGPVYTYQLARGQNQETLKKILDLYPVSLDDSRTGAERPTDRPWRLHFPGANAEMEFLKLDEDSKEPLAGWEDFFTGGSKEAGGPNETIRNGFYEYYPLRGAKPNATVIATFSDPIARIDDGKAEQPYLVIMPYGNGRAAWLGSAEMWRLRQYREAFHERFWTKLARYAGSGTLSQQNRHGVIVMAKTFTANNLVRLQAQMFGLDMLPLARTEKPEAKVKPPMGEPIVIKLQPKAGQSADWNGWFDGQFKVTTPGNYEIQVPIPGLPDILSQKFVVKESNPELDDTAPDFARLREVASEAEDVFSRIKDDARESVKAELERTNRINQAQQDAELKLYFDLKAAELIPDCMITNVKTQRSRGAVKDLWDAGIPADSAWVLLQGAIALLGLATLGLAIALPIQKARGKSLRLAVFSIIVAGLSLITAIGLFIWLSQWWPGDEAVIPVSVVLILVVALLSVEWLTRKLLRLA
jgi:hypothetical protein